MRCTAGTLNASHARHWKVAMSDGPCVNTRTSYELHEYGAANPPKKGCVECIDASFSAGVHEKLREPQYSRSTCASCRRGI